jgi:cellulose synthase/poly-beta-1,6-N-acetylglucosamine synthase-like glycosyltransferase
VNVGIHVIEVLVVQDERKLLGSLVPWGAIGAQPSPPGSSQNNSRWEEPHLPAKMERFFAGCYSKITILPQLIDLYCILSHFIIFHPKQKPVCRLKKHLPVPQILRSLGPGRLSIRMICQLFLLISCFYTSSIIILHLFLLSVEFWSLLVLGAKARHLPILILAMHEARTHDTTCTSHGLRP